MGLLQRHPVGSLSIFLCGVCVLSHADLTPRSLSGWSSSVYSWVYPSLLFMKCFSQGHILACNLLLWVFITFNLHVDLRVCFLLLPSVSLLVYLPSLNTTCPSSTERWCGDEMLPQFTARQMKAGREAAVRCWGGWRGQRLSLLLFREGHQFRWPAQLPAFLLFNLILSVWPTVEKNLLLPTNEKLFVRSVWESYDSSSYAGRSEGETMGWGAGGSGMASPKVITPLLPASPNCKAQDSNLHTDFPVVDQVLVQ